MHHDEIRHRAQLRSGRLQDEESPGTYRSVAVEHSGSITPSAFPLIELSDEQLDVIVRTVPGGSSNIQDIYPLSSLQEGMLFHRLLNRQGDTYVLSTLFELHAHEQIGALAQALQKVIDRHDSLRSAVLWEGLPQPLQVVYREATLPVHELVLDSHRSAQEQLRHLMRPHTLEMNLSRAPLVQLWATSGARDGKWYVLLRVHHVVCDHQSLQLIIAETLACYSGRQDELPVAASHREHVSSAQTEMRSREADAFFRRKLADVDEPTAPFGVLDVHAGGEQMEEAQQEMASALAVDVRLQARRMSVSPARLFHAAWAVVIANTTARDDVVFGTAVLAARQRAGQAGRILGMSVNTLPLRLRLHELTVAELVARTDQELTELLRYEHTPLAEAQRCSGIAGSAPLFTALLNCRRNAAGQEAAAVGTGGEIRVLARGEAWTNYAITFIVDDLGERFQMTVQTDRRIDPNRMIGYFNAAVASLTWALQHAPKTQALSLSILPAAERRELLVSFNATQARYSKEALIHAAIEERVARTPDAVAVVYEDKTLTYARLNARANQLARYLRARGIGPDKLVGICVDRSLEMVVGLLGILKAGGAYVPIDPNYPADRVAYMVKDSSPKVLLTQAHLQKRLPHTESEVVVLDDGWEEISRYGEENLDPRELELTSRNLAYVIYTSGSTGHPKGAMNEHGALINRLQWMQSAYQLNASDRVLQKTPFSFDVSVWEFFWTLMSGAQLVVARPQGHQDPEYLRDVIEARGVTTLHFVPSMLQAFLEGHRAGRCPNVRHVVCSGEELSGSLQQKFFDCFPHAQLSNLYGPTEAAVDVTVWECRQEDGRARVPIGRPIANTQMYVLDRHGKPVPLGVAGEIYIGGVQVGRGYLNRPQLTAERFIKDPFSADPQARLYRTGDVGKWRADGAIEYLGRNDHQVKIRGLRIELGEIEAQLIRNDQVREAVVLAREDAPGEKRLVAYLVPSDASRVPSIDALRTYLKSLVPEYMVPSAFVQLERLPLSPNGKLDRKALPAPELSAYTSRQYEAPQGEVEEIIAGIWQAVLGVERVGRHDNFFELGGHSLLIMQVLERLRRVGLATDVRRVFESPTLAELARVVASEAVEQFAVPENLIPAGCERITPEMLPLVHLEQAHIDRIVQSVPGGATNVQDIYPLAPLQEGILFHHLLNEQGGDTYVLPLLLSVSSRPRLEELIAALQAVIDRHDVLRTAVLWEDLPRPLQVVCRRAPLPVTEVRLDRHCDLSAQLTEWMKPEQQRVDIRRPPLMRLRIAADPSTGQWYVLLQLHHMCIDHVTLEAVTAETVARLEGRAPPTGVPVLYRSHVAQALAYADTGQAETFFCGKLADIDEPTASFGLADVHGDGSNIEEAREDLDAQLAQRVRRQVRQLGVSAATLFHAAWSLAIAHSSGRDDVVLGTVLLGRLQGSAAAQQILGMFINTLPLRLRLRGLTASELVEQTQRELVQLLTHEQASLAVAQRCSGIVGANPLFSTLLNFRHSVPNPDAQWSSASGVELLAYQERTNYPITLAVDDLGEGFALTAQTDRRIPPRRMTGYMRCAVQALVEALEQGSRSAALSLSILPESERRLLVEELNATHRPYQSEKLIHELFEGQVQRRPQAVALMYEGEALTYEQLNVKANQLAHALLAQGVEPDTRVALHVERSLELVIGVLGVLKAGGAYVPLDPTYPPERLAYMLEDAAPKVLLTQGRLRGSLPSTLARVIALDDDWSRIAEYPGVDPDGRARGLRSDHLAYVIYTSGSTGQPKGVMIEHRHVLNLCEGLERLYEQSGTCNRVALNASFNFDASVQQLGQLLAGRAIVIVPPRMRQDPTALLEFLQANEVQGIDCTPSQLKSWVAAGLLEVGRVPLRVVLVGGEAIDTQLWKSLAACTQIDFYNVYGPTECTVDTTVAHLNGDVSTPHIGRPMQNRHVYVLDRHGLPTPLGVSGEIYIGGEGVGRGYLNRPELTAQRFVHDPFSADAQARLYKTGDLGRWREDGAIEYLGRNDHQVKIRGYRMELGEIEAQLARQEQVKEAVVLAREDVPGDKRLVAYLIARDATNAPSVESLRTHMQAMLPEYMVPNAFVQLEHWPLSPSGKLDRKALPAPELGAYASRQYEAPQGEVEEIIAGIWQAVLGVERVGRHDNFFELGGHSLLIMQVLERLRRVGLATDVRRVFESPTLAELARVVASEAVEQFAVPENLIPAGCERITPEMLPLVQLEQAHIDRIVQSVPGGATNVQDIYPLAPLQEGILFHHLMSEQGRDTYVVPLLLSLSSRERLDALVSALQAVIDRHDVLRTAVLWEDLPRPVQVVYRRASLSVEEVALNPNVDPLEQVRQWISPDQQWMDLRQAPLTRLRAAKNPANGEWFLGVQRHHLTSDHVTLELVSADVVAHLDGHVLPASVPYREHVAQALAYASTHDAEAFFRAKLSDIDEPTAPFALLDVFGDGTHIKEACQRIDPQLATRVRSQARRLGVSAATLFHAAWSIVVARTSGRHDVVFGSVLLGRLQGSSGAQRSLGLFINTLPLRLRLQGATAQELVEQTQRELIELLSHEQASLADALRYSGVGASVPLFTALFNYRHSAPNPQVEWSGIRGVRVLGGMDRTNYPITFSVDDVEDGFVLTAQTDRRIDPNRIVEYMNQSLQSLTDAMERAPNTPALKLSILPLHERRQLIEQFNATQATHSEGKLIHQLFEEQVEREPSRVALVHGSRSLTYAELNSKANQLANDLRRDGVGPDQVVGIFLERSLEMIVGLLGILKAGAAYLPLDPNYPPERLRMMLEDSTPHAVLTQQTLRELIPATQRRVVYLEQHLLHSGDSQAENRSTKGLSANNLLYVIYTSGSTGRPKGIAMSHQSMVNLIEWHRSFGVREPQRVLQFAALSFDVAFQEIFSTLCSGHALVLLDEWVRKDAKALLDLLREQRIDRMFLPPLMLQSLAEYCKATETIPRTLKDVVTAGEQLQITDEIVSFFKQLDGCRLHNHYGPTETHVVTSLILDSNPDEWPATPSIGRPVWNTQIYILDAQMQVQPMQVAGEIHIAGANVAHGYLHHPDLTAERFVRDPFRSDSSARMYKTGDLGCWLADGTLQYLGRNDDQVKIRGYRVELGEVEAQLLRHRQVKQAAAIVREDVRGEKRLVAYVIGNEAGAPNVEDLRTHLKSELPAHMVPSAFVVLQSLPLSSSGKLNRRALPAPDLGEYGSGEYDPPQGSVEERLAAIWQELLGVSRVGRNESVFELGGHSLLILKALVRINQSFGSALRVLDIYRSPSVQQLALRLTTGSSDDYLIDLSREAVLDQEIKPRRRGRRKYAQAVLLTGATGFVGRFLLARLLADHRATVYCLVRERSQEAAYARLRHTLLKWDLWDDDFEGRIIAVAGDLRLPRLGTTEGVYESLCGMVDDIYHCATSMNHLETYAMAKAANVGAAQELLKLATTRKTKVVNFISTLGVFSSSAGSGRVVDESTSIDHEQYWNSTGYLASKWVGEKIFILAAERGVPCNIFRLGLVWSDSESGRFDERQATYRLLKSCLLSGYGIENYRYVMAPTPVDYVARAIVHLANRHPDGRSVFHISAAEQWVAGVFERCNEIAGTSLQLLPHYRWIGEIKRLHEAGRSLPIVPLIEYAFSMDAETFYRDQRTGRSTAYVNFDFTRTHRELQQAGIETPVFDDELLMACLGAMLTNDDELQCLNDCGAVSSWRDSVRLVRPHGEEALRAMSRSRTHDM
jgi:amino acid adenylation domain-containing protein/thioester reductase-like protein